VEREPREREVAVWSSYPPYRIVGELQIGEDPADVEADSTGCRHQVPRTSLSLE
jgi:hypothetical protein